MCHFTSANMTGLTYRRTYGRFCQNQYFSAAFARAKAPLLRVTGRVSIQLQPTWTVPYSFSFVCFTQVHHWMHRVDRSLCERLRAFQSPPPMAGMVMVMVMVLLGRPEFAAGIGGAGSSHPPPTRHERKGEQSSSLGTGSDEASRTSSATHKRRGTSYAHHKGSPQTPLLGKTWFTCFTVISFKLLSDLVCLTCEHAHWWICRSGILIFFYQTTKNNFFKIISVTVIKTDSAADSQVALLIEANSCSFRSITQFPSALTHTKTQGTLSNLKSYGN